MAIGEWVLDFRHHDGMSTAEVKPPELKFEIKNSVKGTMTCELPIGMQNVDGTQLRRDSIVPYFTDWYLYRGPNLQASGEVTRINLGHDRDSVLIEGHDWLGYLESRVYPFDPYRYVNEGDWDSWPKQWGVGSSTGVDLKIIAEDIMEAMIEAEIQTDDGVISAVDYTPPFILANKDTGQDGRYKILPGDATSIFDHIRKIADNSDGFEFDILPHNLEFRIYSPDRDQNFPMYIFTVDEKMHDMDWSNEGPLATVTTIYGSGSSIKRGIIRTYLPSIERYRWRDRVADVGAVSSQAMLEKAAAGEQFQDRFPRKRNSWRLHDPELLSPNFWTGGRPRSLIGNRVRAVHDFGFHKVNADYRVMGLAFDISNNNEDVYFEVEMINTPDGSVEFSGGGGYEGH